MYDVIRSGESIASQPDKSEENPLLDNWLRLVVEKGFDHRLIAEAMVGDGHHESLSRALAVLAVFRYGSADLLTQIEHSDLADMASTLYLNASEAQEVLALSKALESPRRARPLFDPRRIANNRVQLPDRELYVRFLCHSPRVAVFDNFLSDEECDELIALGAAEVTPDRIVGEKGRNVHSNGKRSSYGVTVFASENRLAQRIGNRVATLVACDVSGIEAMTLSRYLPGQQFVPHWDYFDSKNRAYNKNTLRGGQRIATVLLYLSAPDAAGGTLFPMAGFDIRPHKGSATYFAYQRGDGMTDVTSFHAGAPVEAGEKWIATFWIREGIWATGRGKSVR